MSLYTKIGIFYTTYKSFVHIRSAVHFYHCFLIKFNFWATPFKSDNITGPKSGTGIFSPCTGATQEQ